MRTSFFTDNAWGFDWGHIGFRIHWYENYGWPKIEKDAWVWQFTAGPFLVNGRRHRLWP